jgi:hypothetical protein
VSRYSLVLIVFIIIGCLPVNGCSSITSDGYKRVIVTKSGIRFSFEYASSYKPDSDTLQNGSENSQATLIHFPKEQKFVPDKMIYIEPMKPDSDHPDAASWLEFYFKGMDHVRANFTLISRETIKVANIDGQKIVFSNTESTVLVRPAVIITRGVYFDYQGLIWEIYVASTQDLSNEAGSDFDHIINTFKFLN